MKPLAIAGAVACGLTLAACEQPVATTPAPDECGAAALQGFVGMEFQEAMIPAEADPVRVLGPGTAATMDFRPDRLNFILDGNDVVAEIKCQ